MRNRPWVLLGDFNAALNLEDHSTGGYESNAAMREFKECVQAMEVSDVNCTDLHFTWNQKPKGSNDILNKIDRIMEGFCEVVESGLALNVDRCNMYRVVKSLKGLKSSFRKLLHVQGNLHNRVDLLRKELDETQKAIDKDPHNPDLHEEHAHYLLAFKEASLDEERFLR
ncbi:RNA-directed DNA polymerase, eukaryota, reverse transcriptase zinc-binding domain protein [Tanacetum coccineum]